MSDYDHEKRVAAGLKAAIHNPNVSEEAKEHAREAIDELEQAPETQETRQGYEEDKDETRVNAGYKATMKSEYRLRIAMYAPVLTKDAA